MRYVIVLVAILFSLHQIKAQNKEVVTSLTGGISFGKLVSDQEREYLKMPFVGLNFGFPLSPKATLNAGAMFNIRGEKTTIPFQKWRYSYIELPLFVQVEVLEDLRFEVGGRGSYLQKYEFGELNGSSNSGIGYIDLEKPEVFNFGFVFGLHSKLSENLSMYLRYDRSLSFSHLTPLHADFRFGFDFKLNQLNVAKRVKIDE